jgi:hypothetical protein
MIRSRVSLLLACVALQSLAGATWGQNQQPQQNPKKPEVPIPRPLPPTPPPRFRGPGLTVSYRGWRTGFTPYPGVTYFRRFRFRHYVPEWTDDTLLVVSPFYFYPNLPPFLNGETIQADVAANSNTTFQQNGDTSQTQNGVATDSAQTQPDPTSQTGPSLTGDQDPKTATNDLKHLWELFDTSVLLKLCPTDGNVKVSVGDQSYNLAASDFLDLIRDGVTGTQTVSWSILNEDDAGDQIRLQAVHTFQDPWDKTRKVTQNYLLVKGDQGYVIREFGSETYQPPSSSGQN